MDFHNYFTDFVGQYWANNKSKMNGLEILQFLNILILYDTMNNKFGMKDPRYRNSYRNLTATFCIRTYNNVLPSILKVAEDMQQNYVIEKDTICMSNGPTDLFRYLNDIFDTYEHCKHEDVCRSIIGLVSRLLNLFQQEYKLMVLESQNMTIEIFCALINSSLKFVSSLRDLMSKMVKQSGLDEEQIKTVSISLRSSQSHSTQS